MNNPSTAEPSPQVDTSALTFQTDADLLKFILGDPRAISVNVRLPDHRAVYPSIVSEGKLDDLIRQHLDGDLATRDCLRKDGSSFSETRHFSYGAYLIRRLADGTCMVPALVLDVDGPDHSAGRTADQVIALARAICERLEKSGLHPVLEYSHGGAGFHIWVFFSEPVPAGFAKSLGEIVLHTVENSKGVEVFPKQGSIREGQRGNPIALPLNGRKISERGGCIVWPHDLSDRPVTTIRCADVALLEPCINTWKEFEAAQARISAAEKARADFNKLLHGGVKHPDDFGEVGLEAVCRALGEVTDDREEEEDIIKLNCPRHASRSRKSLHVDVVNHWWKCNACGDSGAGDMAETLLARWLMPQSTEDQVRQRLLELRARTNSGGVHA